MGKVQFPHKLWEHPNYFNMSTYANFQFQSRKSDSSRHSGDALRGHRGNHRPHDLVSETTPSPEAWVHSQRERNWMREVKEVHLLGICEGHVWVRSSSSGRTDLLNRLSGHRRVKAAINISLYHPFHIYLSLDELPGTCHNSSWHSLKS